MDVHWIWLIQAVVRRALVLAAAVLVGLCLAAPDSDAGMVLQTAMGWTGRQVTDLADALNPFGLHTLPDGATLLCLVGTEGCVRQPIDWQPVPFAGMLPPALQSSRTWLAAGLATATLLAFRRRAD